MKRFITSLLLAGACAGTATAALAQNVTAGDKPDEPAQAAPAEQREMTNPPTGGQTSNPMKSKHDKGDAAFKRADRDHDGTLDQAEAKAMPNVAKNFDAIDADKDGTVSLDEVHAFMKARPEAGKN